MQEQLISTALAIVIVVLCVTIHYEALVQLERLSRRFRRHRQMILVIVHGLLLAHAVQIWVFGMGYYLAQEYLELGTLAPTRDWFDYVYYSAMVYTTVGFGDIVPDSSLRMITSTEALAGLSMITWSASFTFLQMQRIWRR